MRESKHKLNHFEKRQDIFKTGVYCLYHTDNPEKVYVGSTGVKVSKVSSKLGFQCRWRNHLSCLFNNRHENVHLQNEINNLGGIENIHFKILEVIDDDELRIKREQYWLDYYKEYHSVYNIFPTAGSALDSKRQLFKNRRMKRGTEYKFFKPVIQIDINGEIIGTFESAREANRVTGIHYKNISHCCNGRTQHAGGYGWKFQQ